MTNEELRAILTEDIENARKKMQFYREHHLAEAAHYASKLAENIELALTTLPSDDDPEID